VVRLGLEAQLEVGRSLHHVARHTEEEGDQVPIIFPPKDWAEYLDGPTPPSSKDLTPEQQALVDKLIRERNEKRGGKFDEATGMWSFPAETPDTEPDEGKKGSG